MLSQTNKCPPLSVLWPLQGPLLMIAFPLRDRRIREENKLLSYSKLRDEVHLYCCRLTSTISFPVINQILNRNSFNWFATDQTEASTLNVINGCRCEFNGDMQSWIWQKDSILNIFFPPLTSLLLNFCLFISSLRSFLPHFFVALRTVIWKLLPTTTVFKISTLSG